MVASPSSPSHGGGEVVGRENNLSAYRSFPPKRDALGTKRERRHLGGISRAGCSQRALRLS